MTDKICEMKKVHKLFWVWEFEREEQWLNEMAEQGWILEKLGLCRYIFVKGEPCEYHITLEMCGDDAKYIEFMEECGNEKIGKVFNWVYFKRKSSLGAFGSHNDIDYKLKHLSKISKMIAAVGFANIAIGFTPGSVKWLNWGAGCLCMYGLGRIHTKIEQLRKERVIHE